MDPIIPQPEQPQNQAPILPVSEPHHVSPKVIGLIVLTLAFVGVVYGSIWWRNQNTQVLVTQQDEFSDTQNWKIYTNMVFELKYPHNWLLIEPLAGATGAVFETKDGLYVNIKALSKDIISTESIEKSSKSKYDIVVDEHTGTMFIGSDNSATLLVIKGLYAYVFVSGVSDERLKKVLATFKFIEP